MPIRISGLQSGLDTEQIVGALVSAYSYKKDKYTKAQTKLTWKQDAWKTLNSKVYSLYTSVGSMRYSSNYVTKKTTVSDTTKAKATASGTAINGTQELKITQLAKTAYITGGEVSSSITGKSTLSEFGIKNEKQGDQVIKPSIQVRSNSKTTTIELDSAMSVNEFVNKLNDAGVQASFDEKNHRFFISSSKSGKAGDFNIAANNEQGITSLINMGLLTNTEVESITSNTSGSELVARKFTYSIPAADDGQPVEFSLYGSQAGMQQKIRDIVVAHKVLKNDISAQVEIDWANKVLADTDNKNLEAYLKEEFKPAEGELDWNTITDEQMATKAAEMYEAADKTYGSAAQTATSQEVYSAVNNVRDAYVAIAKAKSDKYDSEIEKELAVQQAKDHLTTIMADPANKKWAEYIQKNFGTVNTGTTDDYSDFWVQSDNLELAKSVFYRVDLSAQIQINKKEFTVPKDLEAHQIKGADAIIELNGVQYTNDTNNVTVNGLTIECLATTGENAITVTVDSDTDALYDKVKDFLTSYNTLMNEMQKLYNADSAKDYEPLTDDEKAELSESEIEKWEQKIKDSLLRRDNSLSGIIQTMTMSMMKTYEVNGQMMSWSTFGVHTLGTLNAEKNEGYAFHIDGDSEDSKVSGNKEKLRAALAEDPDSVIDFLKQMTTGLYNAMDQKMKSTAVKSVYTVYNDKEMEKEQQNYSKLIKQWEDRVKDMEDSYYKKFSQMESALAKLQSSSSSISSLLGM